MNCELLSWGAAGECSTQRRYVPVRGRAPHQARLRKDSRRVSSPVPVAACVASRSAGVAAVGIRLSMPAAALHALFALPAELRLSSAASCPWTARRTGVPRLPHGLPAGATTCSLAQPDKVTSSDSVVHPERCTARQFISAGASIACLALYDSRQDGPPGPSHPLCSRKRTSPR